MKLKKIRIQNFRAHRDTELPLSQFGCLIGENNAGKSSVLHALHFALKGSPPSKLEAADFNNPQMPVRVEIDIADITPDDLMRITDESQRTSVAHVLTEGNLTLVRTAPLVGKTALQYLQLIPKDDKWDLSELTAEMKGKSGSKLREAAVARIPELDAVLEAKPTQTTIKALRENLIKALPREEFSLRESPLPTGIEAAIRPLLPEVIYIEAVKDASAETKTTDSSTFGKLLKILLDEVADQFSGIEKAFSMVQRKLSRIPKADGLEDDFRLDEVKMIESTIENFVQESFPGVSLRMDVPAPELRTILGGAELRIDDGHEGLISNKGDGLKRTVAFAILRAYMSLRDGELSRKPEKNARRPSYLLLFEEPELYLHPRAQRQLFDALARFAQDHPVMVTTHSPLFFSAESTSSFVKLQKVSAESDGAAMVRALPLDFRHHLSARDAFQIVCHENNEAALFSRKVVLVEGESDVIVFPHIAKLLEQSWDHVEQNIVFIRTGGKTNISRYKEFFKNFDIEVHAVADLDAIVDGFNHLTQQSSAYDRRQLLMAEVAALQATDQDVSGKKIRKATDRGDIRARWKAAESAFQNWKTNPTEDLVFVIEENLEYLFEWPRGNQKLNILQEASPRIEVHFDALLNLLREEGVHILRRGDLETYYGGPRNTYDKVRFAMEFCANTPSLEAYRDRHGAEADLVERELRTLLAPIYAT